MPQPIATYDLRIVMFPDAAFVSVYRNGEAYIAVKRVERTNLTEFLERFSKAFGAAFK